MLIFLGMGPSSEMKEHLERAYQWLGEAGNLPRMPAPHGLVASRGGVLQKGHFHLRAELFIQATGITRFRFPQQSIDLGPGEILLVPSRLYHAETILPSAQPFRNLVLYADESALSCHLADGNSSTGPRIAYPEHREGGGCSRVAGWLADCVELSREPAGGGAVVADLLRTALGLTLKLLATTGSQSTIDPLTVVRCRRLIHEDLGNSELSVASLARRLEVSADYLSHLFRSVRGQKLTSYVEDLRMERAAELLTQTALSCKQVAWMSGYANQSYFIRCFRRRWGQSPLDFRRGSA